MKISYQNLYISILGIVAIFWMFMSFLSSRAEFISSERAVIEKLEPEAFLSYSAIEIVILDLDSPVIASSTKFAVQPISAEFTDDLFCDGRQIAPFQSRGSIAPGETTVEFPLSKKTLGELLAQAGLDGAKSCRIESLISFEISGVSKDIYFIGADKALAP